MEDVPIVLIYFSYLTFHNPTPEVSIGTVKGGGGGGVDLYSKYKKILRKSFFFCSYDFYSCPLPMLSRILF